MDRQLIHEQITDILGRISFLNDHLRNSNKILPMEVDLLKNYQTELQRLFDLLTIGTSSTTAEPGKITATEPVQEQELEPSTAEQEAEPVEEPEAEPIEVVWDAEAEEQETADSEETIVDEDIETVAETIATETVADAEPIVEAEAKQEPEPVAKETPVEPEPKAQETEETLETAEPEPEARTADAPQEEIVADAEPEAEPEPAAPKATETPDEKPKQASLNDRFNKPDQTELGYRLRQPLRNLREMIDLSEKYVYTKELFGGDADYFERTLRYLNQCNSYAEATDYIATQVKPKFKWEGKEQVEERFTDLVKQKFN